MTGELVRKIQEQGSVVYDEQGQAQDPFSMFAVTDDLPQGKNNEPATTTTIRTR